MGGREQGRSRGKGSRTVAVVGREQDRSIGRQGAGQEQGEAGSRTGEGGDRE